MTEDVLLCVCVCVTRILNCALRSESCKPLCECHVNLHCRKTQTFLCVIES